MGLSALVSAEHIPIEDSLPPMQGIGDNKPCTKSRDCPKGLRCFKEIYESGNIAENGLCKERGGLGDHCTLTKWCGDGLMCADWFSPYFGEHNLKCLRLVDA
ncbi:unnamed protein product [Vitrella brassicaformis CCMP3155]|uniref:Dickkopf N-terminal cysteine-rich domain-containing protein n=2 Tax=Vitrella brassicaformis TaxID=1169539 RepID=A0A0G4F3U4_VITBC|nr:unnamed protein product [Vitrella brassicaformis CCMP3155]|eukprot:CEM06893.1 unnamed protein product [Vitrella brassicaformis CCMP3155]